MAPHRPAWRLVYGIGAALALAGCGDAPAAGGADAGDALDVGTLDDTAAADVASPGDAVEPGDSGAGDTVAPADTSDGDSAPADDTADSAEPPDSAAEDTVEAADTSDGDSAEAADSAVGDTSEATDTVAVDTVAPTDTVAADTVDPGPEALPPADTAILSGPPYLMWVTETEVSVRWETTTEVVGRVDHGPTDALGTTLSEASPRRTHELRLTGLNPGVEWAYRVVYGGGALPLRSFRTAPAPDDPRAIQFIVWGDNQDGPETFAALVPWMADLAPDFALSVGDCVQNGTRAEYRSQLFQPLAGFADEVPYLVAAGNHERYQDPSASLFDEYFSQPDDEHCFGWRYGALFVLVIDTELGLDGATGQRACVEAALASPAAQTATIRAAAFHKPPRVEWWFGGALAFPDSMEAPWVREDLEPLLESYGVDIVFNGHNHLYAYTPETAGGITWVTTGGGGGYLDSGFGLWRVGYWPQIETTIHEHHFLRATLSDGELFVEAVDLDGEVLHSFTVMADD